jgi:Raf kinase inhibitor-like YbhB/YbcL family protein
MNINRTLIALAIATGLVVSAGTQALPTSGHSAQLLMKDVPYTGKAKLTVTSPAFKDGGDIPYENTQYRGNVFPGLSWTKGPAGTQSYVVIFQGLETEGPHGGGTVIALTVFNVPASVTKLDVGMTSPPDGAVLGPNVRGPNKPYAGPHVKGTDKHDYFIQVFALDTALAPDPMTTYETLVSGMTGHVVAVGVLRAKSDKDPNSKES